MKSLESLDRIKAIQHPGFFEELKNEFCNTYLQYHPWKRDFQWNGEDSFTIDYHNPHQQIEKSYTHKLSEIIVEEINYLFKSLKNSLKEDFIHLSDPTKKQRLIDTVMQDLNEINGNILFKNVPEKYCQLIKNQISIEIKSVSEIQNSSGSKSRKRLGYIQLENIDTYNNEKFRNFYTALTKGKFISTGSSVKLRKVFDGANLSNDSSDLRIEWLGKATEAKYLFQRLSDKKAFPHINMKNKWIAITNNFKIFNASGIELDSESIRVVGDIPKKQKDQEKELNSILDTLRN
ncbi:hypothetical protein [Christiangramia echinicola]|uniref:hypothetical protein n=1 Tax=Christiangramia echinicola TaxID=279359 RepID=UPI00041E3523|nr:hypothetical protein [Christiangramia echinicola]